MSDKEGWISLHRKIQDCFLWNEKPFDGAHAWVDLLLLANHEDKKTYFDSNVITVCRGQRITSIRKLCERWGWSNTKVIKFLTNLENEGMITRKSDTKKTLLTIVNYDIYQNGDVKKRHRNDTETTQKHTNNNENNENKENNITPHTPLGGDWDYEKNSNIENVVHYLNHSETDQMNFYKEHMELFAAVKDWMAYKDTKKPRSKNHYGKIGIEKLITRLINESNSKGVECVCNSIDDSIANNYVGIIFKQTETIKPANQDWRDNIRGKK